MSNPFTWWLGLFPLCWAAGWLLWGVLSLGEWAVESVGEKWRVE
jgi:hypothetical protein